MESNHADKSRDISKADIFIRDRIEQNKITVEYCPTKKMLADFFTKPLQGELFCRFRDVIIGYKHISSLMNMSFPTSMSKERVEQTEQAINTDRTGTAIKTKETQRNKVTQK